MGCVNSSPDSTPLVAQRPGKPFGRKAKKQRKYEKVSLRADENLKFIDDRLQSFNPKMDRLRDLDLFVLDNSIRETTVGQLRGHTLEDKFAIYEQVKKCGFKYCVVESFHHMSRVGDKFLQLLKDKGEDMSHMFAFSEFIEVVDENKVPKDDLPIGCIKSKQFGLKNIIIEIDLCYHGIDYSVFNSNRMFELLDKRLKWVCDNLGADSKVLINLRDFGNTMNFFPSRVLGLIRSVIKLPKEHIPFGIMVEELGKYLPEETSVWTAAIRREMDRVGWTDGHLLVHVHEQWGMADATQLDMLAAGANGIWAGVCAEGAAMGHASSCITIMNLIRLGNTKILDKYNCRYLRDAAVEVTHITTGEKPHPKQHVYGARALDLIFGLEATKSRWEFNFAEYLGVKPEIRITTLAEPEMFLHKLIQFFGEDEQFTLEIATEMKKKMLENLQQNRKEEAKSMVGLAMLFDQSGGRLTEDMAKKIEKDESYCHHISELITKIKARWDHWDLSDGVKDDQLTFDNFYNGFMAPYFGCYRCEDTRRALVAIDMDRDGRVDWNEFALYLKWAGREYPETKTDEDLLDIAFRRGLIPAMQDVLLPEGDDILSEEQEGAIHGDVTESKGRRFKNTIKTKALSVFYHRKRNDDKFFADTKVDG